MTQYDNLLKEGQNDAEPLFSQLENQLRTFISDKQISNPVFVGIETGGAWIAKRLHDRLKPKTPLGTLNISFYRDDFSQGGLHPQVSGSCLLTSIENQEVILIDDVLMTGRTIRAAMNELFDFGRPKHIYFVALIDIGRRELPIHPDVCAININLLPHQSVKLIGPSPLNLIIE
jgi:pyrimidine operon attenuation protein/uracil phosphoribosyltransferase